MTTAFERAAAKASRVIDRVYGEEFEIIAMAEGGDVNLPRGIDADRPAFTTIGAYFSPSAARKMEARSPFADERASNAAVSSPQVSIDTVALRWPVSRGDVVVRKSTSEQFEVVRALPDGVARTMIHLSARKRADV